MPIRFGGSDMGPTGPPASAHLPPREKADSVFKTESAYMSAAYPK
jgi:hypothetical protein